MPSLNKFVAAASEPGRRCTVCNLPESIQQVIEDNEAQAKPHPRRVVAAWASSEVGRRVSADMIYKHLNHY